LLCIGDVIQDEVTTFIKRLEKAYKQFFKQTKLLPPIPAEPQDTDAKIGSGPVPATAEHAESLSPAPAQPDPASSYAKPGDVLTAADVDDEE
jgi:hypothetical protein